MLLHQTLGLPKATGMNAKLNGVTDEGLDTDLAWNDRHLQYVYLWLVNNPSSPYKSSPAMLLTAMDVDKCHWSSLRRSLKAGKLYIRFSVRMRLTAKLKMVIDGQVTPRIDKRDSKNRIIKYTILPASNPQAISIPQWIKGGIRVTTKGLQLLVRQTASCFTSRHDPQDKERLTNPFGRV